MACLSYTVLLASLAYSTFAAPLYPSTVASRTKMDKRWEQGISDGAMIINWIGLGFLPDFSRTTISDLNAALPLPMAVAGDYIAISPSDTSLTALQSHRSDLLAQGTKSVYMATIMPESLPTWNATQADIVSEAMAALNAEGVPTWVRFAHEMNGCPAWYSWGCDPSGYLAAWSIMATSLRAKAPQAKLLWSPNIDTSGADGQGNYAQYYPGDDVVDIVGLDLYSFGVDQQLNTLPTPQSFYQLASPFYNQFSAPKDKPFVLCETSAAYHYFTNTSDPITGGASEYDIKTQWLDQVMGSSAHEQFPNMIAAVWFNYEKDERDQTIDYRALLGNIDVQEAVHAMMNW